MKNVILILLFCFSAVICFGQAKNVRKADAAREKGDLAEAKTLIDEGIQDEKAKDDDKSWYIRGQIYQAIAEDSTNSMPAEEGTLETAVEAYNKAKELGKEGSTYYVFADQKLEEIWANSLNKGAEYYQNQDYENAITYFEKSMLAKPKDTTAYLYAGISAQSDGKYDKAEENYLSLIDLGYKNEDVYNFLINLYLTEKKDSDKAIEYLIKAQEAFPENIDFLKREIVVLINEGKQAEAEQKIKKAIEKDPQDPTLYYNQGFMYEQMDRGEDALASYKKATELKPDYFDATFNIAAYYYNEAAEILQKANNMDLKEYQQKGKQIEEEAKGYFEKSLPYLEKAKELQPEDVKVLSTLQTVYTRLGMKEKADEIEAKLSNM